MINNNIKLKNNKLKSKIIGGDMTLVENSIGTSWQVNAKDKITHVMWYIATTLNGCFLF